MTKVHELQTASARASAHTVDLLKEALAEAEAGTIQECALAIVYRDKATGWRRSSSASIPTLIGSVSILHHDLLAYARENS